MSLGSGLIGSESFFNHVLKNNWETYYISLETVNQIGYAMAIL